MLTNAQERLIAKAKAAGFGYALFAASVERQGWCSEKQEQTLRKCWTRTCIAAITGKAYDVAQAGIDAVTQWVNQPKDTK